MPQGNSRSMAWSRLAGPIDETHPRRRAFAKSDRASPATVAAACDCLPRARPCRYTTSMASSGPDLPRAALEAIALETYRERKLSTAQLRRLLGYQTRMEVDGFLKEHGVELE